MEFLHDDALDKEVMSLLSNGRCDAAVAFWGEGAHELVKHAARGDVRIVCNLMSGGTNPREIVRLQSVAAVRQMDDLHAKVYIGPEYTIVTSANASINGLGLQAREQSHWREAGVKIATTEPIKEWFRNLFESDSSEITSSDIKRAEKLWGKRVKLKPKVKSFADYVLDDNAEIIPNWYEDSDYKVNKSSFDDSIVSSYKSIEDAVDNGIEISSAEDFSFFDNGRWALHFKIREDGSLAKKPKPSWVFTGTVVTNAYYYGKKKRELYHCALPALHQPPEPFDASDEAFLNALAKVFDRYDDLKGEVEIGQAWYLPRKESMRNFWRDVQKEYRSMVDR